MNILNFIVYKTNDILWGKNILVFLLIGAAIYFTIKTRFMQFRLFNIIIKVLFNNEKEENGVSSLETFFIGTASRVGAGNITGVIAAISIGGAGSIFWMWLVALLGSATAFVEASLAVIYSEKKEDGSFVGGTPYILEKRFNLRSFGIVYAIASIVCYLGVIQIMSNSITHSITSVYFKNNKSINISIALLLSVFVFFIVFLLKGEKDAIILSLNKIVPIMAIMYILIVLFVLITNITSIPNMIAKIFSQAFGFEKVAGGILGAVVMNGVKRGLFSNEAGSGNSTYVAATVSDQNPTKQGMVQVLGVFIDTLVICSATAFIVLLAPESVSKGLANMSLFQSVMFYHIGSVGSIFVIVTMFFFCMSTILAVIFYGKSALGFINDNKYINYVYQIVAIIMIYVGAVGEENFVWNLVDFGLGIMTLINISFIVFTSKDAINLLFEYEKGKSNEK